MANVTFQFNNGWERDLAKEISRNVSKKLEGVNCAIHGERPTVVVKGRGMSDLSFEVHGCCKDLIERSLARLK